MNHIFIEQIESIVRSMLAATHANWREMSNEEKRKLVDQRLALIAVQLVLFASSRIDK